MPRKSYPSSKTISGMYFPSSASSGNCIPFQASILGRIFPLDPQPETASHFERKFRDAFFESLPIRKARPTLDASGHGTIDLSGLPSIKRRPPGRRGTKFIASSARKEGHLMWPSSCAGLFEILRKHPPCRGSRVPVYESDVLSNSLKSFGLPLPRLAFMHWPTKKPMTFWLPSRYCCA